MKLNNSVLHEILNQKGILHFYHANTVATSITFIEQGGLLARGDVERENLIQTIQVSDDDDKLFDVWDDVFIDIVDLHGFFPRQNLYGPILFKFNIDLLLDDNLNIYVTKNNPIYWNLQLSEEEKYFQDADELEKNWDNYPLQQKMFTIRKPGNPVLFDYLEEIIVDDPQVIIYENINLYQEALNALKKTTEHIPELQKKIKTRVCSNCYCQSNYFKQIPHSDLRRLFLPFQHP
ncbi:hypothetical protein [Proteus penneri]|uniref:DUF4433 domain-containing protein n=1 Tax=Proteus penneri TaxID=102862 RepID=A0A0G4PZ82_9GAMM|nr:hypothetical protein [Proteus penneri]CRL59012.1 hypothetical protein BN1804_00184 [Proteus penneri]